MNDGQRIKKPDSKEAEDQAASGGSSGTGSSSGVALKTLDEKQQLEHPISPSTEAAFHRDIVFADEVKDPAAANPNDLSRLPEHRSPEEHIAFIQNQRNPKDKKTLRIPGPRDFDRGDKPHALEDGGDLTRKWTDGGGDGAPPSPSWRKKDNSLDVPDHPVRRNITIDDSNHPHVDKAQAGIRALNSPFKPRQLERSETFGTSAIGRTLSGLRARAKTGTLSRTKTSRSADPTPYLSWQATLGRNSAFVDLNEEQREELGGIEYRALKTLAFTLCG